MDVWLDCDPGHDDAFALLLLAHHGAFNLVGVSTVYGNAPLSNVTENAARLLTLLRRTDVPVHPGASGPFCREAKHAPDIHGESGLDTTYPLPPPSPKVDVASAPPFLSALVSHLTNAPDQSLYLVATGALTNIALLLSAFPALCASKLASLTIMGGCIGRGFTQANLATYVDKESGEVRARKGNTTPFAEFNIYIDPEAARAVFTSPLAREGDGRVALVPLDTTHLVRAGPERKRMVLADGGSEVRKVFASILDFFNGTYEKVFGLGSKGAPMHDVLAAAVLLGKDGGVLDADSKERWDVNVQTGDEGGRRGETVAEPVAGGGRGVRIPREVDAERFWAAVEVALVMAERA